MTFIVPKGGLEESSLWGSEFIWPPLATRVMQELLEFSISDQLAQMIPQIPGVLGGVSLVLVVVAIKALIVPYGISCHLIWPFEE